MRKAPGQLRAGAESPLTAWTSYITQLTRSQLPSQGLRPGDSAEHMAFHPLDHLGPPRPSPYSSRVTIQPRFRWLQAGYLCRLSVDGWLGLSLGLNLSTYTGLLPTVHQADSSLLYLTSPSTGRSPQVLHPPPTSPTPLPTPPLKQGVSTHCCHSALPTQPPRHRSFSHSPLQHTDSLLSLMTFSDLLHFSKLDSWASLVTQR